MTFATLSSDAFDITAVEEGGERVNGALLPSTARTSRVPEFGASRVLCTEESPTFVRVAHPRNINRENIADGAIRWYTLGAAEFCTCAKVKRSVCDAQGNRDQ